METIFDHSVTDAELIELFGRVRTRSEYNAVRRTSDSEFGMIATLYRIRGDDSREADYLRKISDTAYRDAIVNHCLPR
jgi:hypothetical protein